MSSPYTIAEKLLDAGAIKLRPSKPFTWSSGWKSPIYCDNRMLLSIPESRMLVINGMLSIIEQEFSDVECIAGVATAGIPWGSIVAQELNLPFIYVRPKPKEHGLSNQVEGIVIKGQKVVVIEDLISTGVSSLQACKVLKKEKLKIVGVVSIFNYGFPHAIEAFSDAKIPFYSLSNYEATIDRALDREMVTQSQIKKLLKWQDDPANWKK